MCNCGGKKKLKPVNIPVAPAPPNDTQQQVSPPPTNLKPVINKAAKYRNAYR